MKIFLIVLGFVVLVYTFAILTGSHGSVYNATDNQLITDFSNFKPSYQDATSVAESIK